MVIFDILRENELKFKKEAKVFAKIVFQQKMCYTKVINRKSNQERGENNGRIQEN